MTHVLERVVTPEEVCRIRGVLAGALSLRLPVIGAPVAEAAGRVKRSHRMMAQRELDGMAIDRPDRPPQGEQQRSKRK